MQYVIYWLQSMQKVLETKPYLFYDISCASLKTWTGYNWRFSIYNGIKKPQGLYRSGSKIRRRREEE